MKDLIYFLILFAFLISCKKGNPVNTPEVSYYLNGKYVSQDSVVNGSFEYMNGKLFDVLIQLNQMILEIQFNETHYPKNGDTLMINRIYFPGVNYKYGISPNYTTLLGNDYFQIKFTRISDISFDGTFSGTVKGVIPPFGISVSDSITEGIFKNVPLYKYHN